MLRNLNELENYVIQATDGDIGHLKDCYFEDDTWVVRYFVVDAGTLLTRRMVLVSPISVHRSDWLGRSLAVSITRDQVKHSPDIDTDQPVSRQNEVQYLGYYGYPPYWGGGDLWGAGSYPDALVPGHAAGERLDHHVRERELEVYLSAEKARHRNDDPHLRSCKAVTGYRIHAKDGDIGHVTGFLADDETWAIRFLVVDTSNWWVGHKVLIAPLWIDGIDWTERTVSVDISREAIQTAPPFESIGEWNREQELRLFRHYTRRDYRDIEPALESGR